MKEKELIQATIDRILYCPNYIEALKELNAKFNPHDRTKFTDNISEFKFSLSEAF